VSKKRGRGITKYIKNIRLKNALRLLKETEANVAMISESVGYSDTQYFYRIFKKEKGVTAIEYRKQYIE
jgi:two-component system, response regulator YesN